MKDISAPKQKHAAETIYVHSFVVSFIQVMKTWKTLLVVDNYYAISTNHIFRLFPPPRFSSYFVNLEFSSPQIIKTLILMEKSENKKVSGDRIF